MFKQVSLKTMEHCLLFSILWFIVLWTCLSIYLSFHFLLYAPYGHLEQQYPLGCKLFFFVSIKSRSGVMAGIKWSFCNSKSQRILWASFLGTDSAWCIYHLFSGQILVSYTILIGSHTHTHTCIYIYIKEVYSSY